MISIAKQACVRFASVLRITSTRRFRITPGMMEEQDELEYNITFPTPTGDENPDVKEPVVYLLGWVGATDKLLAKYSAIYEKEGCVTLRYTVCTDDMFMFSYDTIMKLQETSQKLLQLLDDYELRENPVIFHVFSNGGSSLYRWAAEAFLKEKVNIIGVVMDSCPSRLTVVRGLTAIYFTQRGKGIFSFLSYAGRFLFNSVKLSLPGFWDPKLDAFESIKSSESNFWPHLFLYSTNDGIIPPADVLEVADGRKNAGARFVKTYDFESSIHVMHLRFFKEKYIEECQQFLDDCLRIYDGEEIPTDLKRSEDQTSSVDPERVRSDSENEPSTSRRRRSAKI